MGRIRYKVRGTDLRLEAGSAVSFDLPIAQIVDFPEMLVVRLDVPRGMVYNENIFGVGPAGKIAWQIGAREWVRSDTPYTAMSREGDLVRLYNYEGFDIWVDPYDGSVIREEFTK